MIAKTDFHIYIRPGREVYDLNEDKVGTVKHVELPEGALTDVDATDLQDDDLRRIVAAWNSCGNVPLEARERFLQDGFVRLNTGVVRADRYFLPEHIRSVSANRVTLRVRCDDLL